MRPLRALPAGRLRAANYIYRRRLKELDGSLRQTRLEDGSRFALEVSEWPQAQAYLLGEYDRPTVEFVAANLPPGGVFVDVGAHVGLITFQVARSVGGNVSVHAFEPHPRRGEQFRRNLAMNPLEGFEVSFSPVGLSDAKGETGYDLDSHKIRESGDSIAVIRLDDYLAENNVERVDVMKLDIEGHELQALRGAETALSEHRIGAVTLEAMDAHGDTARPRELLEGFGYRWTPLGEGSSSPNEAYLVA